jgi:tellurite resistance protein TerA
MARDKSSRDSLSEAERYHAEYSGHGKAIGAKGTYSDTDDHRTLLGRSGETLVVDPDDGGYEKIRIGGAWQNIRIEQVEKQGFFEKLFGKAKAAAAGKSIGVDLDIGCLYEMQDGTRGAIQAFGDMYGDYNNSPFIKLSGDDRTGDDHDDDDGEDEVLRVNGKHWGDIRRLLVYFYIYDGAANWAEIKPEVRLHIPGHKPMVIRPHIYNSNLPVCCVAGIENQRNGIKLTNFTEYFPGHAEMDRAHGYGLQWDDGEKS